MKGLKLLLAIIITLAVELPASATIWRVNNNTSVDADYTTISAAISAASAGDTIHVEGSSTAYSNGLYITKKIVIIGPGFFLDKNDSTQVNKQEARISNYIYFASGAEGSVLTGIYQNTSSYYTSSYRSGLVVACDSVSILRNHFLYTYTGSGSYYSAVQIRNNIDNVSIIGNWIVSTYSNNDGLAIRGATTSILVANNFIVQSRDYGENSSNTSYRAIRVENNSNNRITFLNNVIHGSWDMYYCVGLNNIHVTGSINYSASTSTFYNNIGYNTSLPTGNNNLRSQSMSNVFDRSTNGATTWHDDDNWWRLKTGSSAIGAGVSGEDCGIYGGALQYNPSGLPAVPAIFDATIPATTDKSSGLSIDVSSKSHK